MFDPELYRTKGEVEEWKKRDPIPRLISQLRQESLIREEDLALIEKEILTEVEDAIAFADAGQLEPVDELTRFVYSEQRRTA
jgi:TPP-dependent pyruvate/acetoin dehydrogenase alpha subunit